MAPSTAHCWRVSPRRFSKRRWVDIQVRRWRMGSTQEASTMTEPAVDVPGHQVPVRVEAVYAHPE